MGYAVTWKGHNHDYSLEVKRKAEDARFRNALMMDLKRCSCPNCRAPLEFGIKTIRCTNFCGFAVYKKIAGVVIPDMDMIQLLNRGKTSLIKGFYSKKTGKTFDACLYWDFKTKTIKFSFN